VKGRNKGMKRMVSGFILTLLLTGMLSLAFNVSQVKADGSWVWVRDTVTGSYGGAIVGTGTAIYIARGTGFYRYLPADDSWVELASPPMPDGYAFKTGTALAWDFGDYIYALCGAATGDSRRWFFRYSISTDSWETLANTTAYQGEGNALTWVSIDNCIYATIGGEQRPTYFVRYDPLTNSWSDAPADPPAGMGDGASLVWTGGEYLYALRGEFLESEALYDFWRYSLTDNAWTGMADVPALPHSGGTGGVGDGGSLLYAGFWLPSHEDYIYSLSGNQAHPDGIPDNRTYRYTISTNSWERLADLPFGVGYYVGCRLGYAEGHIYAWQGAPSTWTGGGDDLAKYRLAWIVDDDGPADFHIIQEAINAANPGDTIYVKAGTYYENVVLNKTLSLIGENRENTIIDANGTGVVIDVRTHDVTVSDFTIQNGSSGIEVFRSNNIVIKGNVVANNNAAGHEFSGGISLMDSKNNTINGNIITKNGRGITMSRGSHGNNISSNVIEGNIHGIMDYGIFDRGGMNTINCNTIANNDKYGIALREQSWYNVVTNNFIINNSKGIYLFQSSYNTIESNVIAHNGNGTYLDWNSANNIIVNNTVTDNIDAGFYIRGWGNTISNNTISNNKGGIYIESSRNNTLRNNNMTGNRWNFGVVGWDLPSFIHDIDTSNTADGKPIHYLINQSELIINPTTFLQVGYLAAINSTNILIENLTITNNIEGLLLVATVNSTVLKLNVENSYVGLVLGNCQNNTIQSSTIKNNEYGIFSTNSSNNRIYHNNFIDNQIQTAIYVSYWQELYPSINIWDNGYPSGGNYWSDFNGTDLHWGSDQNEAGSDGIGDAAHEIDADNRDRYPLMAPFSMFDAGTWNGTAYNVDVVTNSTVSNFQVDAVQKTISFNVTGVEETEGFCRVTIPHIIVQDLWQDNYTVLLNGEPWPFRNWTDPTYTYIYINYTHSQHQIVIIPEFPSFLILPLLITLATLAVISTKRRTPRKPKT
jgi:parallel beta-helix repeat protein